MGATRPLVLGTRNAKKRAELVELFQPHGFQLLTLEEFPDSIEVVEDGNSFAENAALKASQQAQVLKQWVLGEDSGLVVDSLEGAPGIFSARYSGPNASDASNNIRLLEEMKDVAAEQRTAHYVCHVALSDPDGEIRLNDEAYCCGRIRHQEVGQGGFGYDPLFEIREYHRTFAELGNEVKSVLSHRARAMRRLIPAMMLLVQQGHWPQT